MEGTAAGSGENLGCRAPHAGRGHAHGGLHLLWRLLWRLLPALLLHRHHDRLNGHGDHGQHLLIDAELLEDLHRLLWTHGLLWLATASGLHD